MVHYQKGEGMIQQCKSHQQKHWVYILTWSGEVLGFMGGFIVMSASQVCDSKLNVAEWLRYKVGSFSSLTGFAFRVDFNP